MDQPMVTPKFQWLGREVRFDEIDIRAGKEVRAAFAQDNEMGMWVILAKSARYSDDGSLVFASIDEVMAQPFKLQQRLMRLAGQAVQANGMEPDEDQNGPPA